MIEFGIAVFIVSIGATGYWLGWRDAIRARETTDKIDRLVELAGKAGEPKP